MNFCALAWLKEQIMTKVLLDVETFVFRHYLIPCDAGTIDLNSHANNGGSLKHLQVFSRFHQDPHFPLSSGFSVLTLGRWSLCYFPDIGPNPRLSFFISSIESNSFIKVEDCLLNSWRSQGGLTSHTAWTSTHKDLFFFLATLTLIVSHYSFILIFTCFSLFCLVFSFLLSFLSPAQYPSIQNSHLIMWNIQLIPSIIAKLSSILTHR